jgi:hypothetical protein
MITVNLGSGVNGQVVAGRRSRQQPGLFLHLEQLDRPASMRSMDPLSGPDQAPLDRPTLGVGQIDESFSGKETVTHERHRPFHPRLGLTRRLHPIDAMSNNGFV